MKKLLTITIALTAINSFAQDLKFWDSDVKDVIGILEYTDGITLKKNYKRNEIETDKWNVNTEGNVTTYTNVVKPKYQDKEQSITLNVTYDDMNKKSPEIVEIHQVIQDEAGKEKSNRVVFTANFSKDETMNASKCGVRDENAKNREFECTSVDYELCVDLNKALDKSKLDVTELSKCSEALEDMQKIFDKDTHLKRIQKSASYKKTMSKMDEGKITKHNGREFFGKQTAKDGSIVLKDIFSMAHLCKQVGVDNKKQSKNYKGSQSQKQPQKQTQEEG